MRASIALLLFVACAQPPLYDDVGSVEEAIVVCPGATTVEGIDVSHWQATIDWDRVAADGVVFAFIRVSHGTGTMDREFATNWPEAQRVGVIRGVYQYFSPGDDPIAQADLLIDAIGGELAPGDLPPVLDVEALEGESADVAIANMRVWLDHVEAMLGVRPIIYTAFYFWRDQLGAPDFGEYPLWVANYGVSCPNVPPPWTGFDFWQYTSTGSVDGIAGNVDRNVWNGDLDSLIAFAGTVAMCGDGVCSSSETPATCAVDCPTCQPIPALGRVVDETEVCFTRGGPAAYWRDEAAGWDGHLIWTHTTDAATEANFASWALTFDEGGRYLVEAYTQAPYAQSTQATYEVRHAGNDELAVVDQTLTDGWNAIGEYEFAAGGDQHLYVGDNTGEPGSTNTQLVADAIRLTRLDVPPMLDAGAGDAGTDGDAGVEADAGTDGPPLSGDCGCRAAGRAPSAPWALALLFIARWRALRGKRSPAPPTRPRRPCSRRS